MASVTLQQIKTALKIEYSNDDADLLRLRDAVEAFVYSYCGITISPKTYTMYLDYWMKARFVEYPFIEVDTVSYTDVNGNTQTMTDYFLDKSKQPNSTFINFSEYPEIEENSQIEVKYKAGYSLLPADLQHAILSFIGAWYNNPEALSPIALQEVPISAKFVLDTLKVKNGVLE